LFGKGNLRNLAAADQKPTPGRGLLPLVEAEASVIRVSVSGALRRL
jgi:hypothetical protein